MAPSPRATTLPLPIVVPPSLKFEGNDGSWSTFSVSVGTPGQDFHVLVSTVAGTTYVVVEEGCQADDSPKDCPSSRGAQIFRSIASPGFQPDESSTWIEIGNYASTLGTNVGYDFGAKYGYDTVRLGTAQDDDAVALDGQLVSGFADDRFWLGFLGLSTQDVSVDSTSEPISSFFQNLGDRIPSYTYSYAAGASYRWNGVPGSLILGGYDDTRFERADVNFQFDSDPGRRLTVGVQSITGDGTLRGTYSFTTEGYSAVIDSTVSQLWLPKDVCDRFAEAFGLDYDEDTELYTVNDTIHDRLVQDHPSVTFNLGYSVTDPSEFVNIELPYDAFDLEASYPMYDPPRRYFPIRRAEDDTQYTLGRAFLQEAYLIVDYLQQNFSVFQAAYPEIMPDPHIVPILPPGTDSGVDGSDGSSTDPSNPTDPDEGESDGGGGSSFGAGGIAGVVVGLLIVIALLGAAWYFLWDRTRRRKQLAHELPVEEQPWSNDAPPPQKTPPPAKAPHELSTEDIGMSRSPDSLGFYAAKTFSELSAEGGRTELPSPPPLYEMMAEDYVSANRSTTEQGPSSAIPTRPTAERELSVTSAEIAAAILGQTLTSEERPAAERGPSFASAGQLSGNAPDADEASAADEARDGLGIAPDFSTKKDDEREDHSWFDSTQTPLQTPAAE